MGKCIYKSPNGLNCEHSRGSSLEHLCQFHLPREDEDKLSSQQFIPEIENLLKNKDESMLVNMQGFIFPAGFKLENKQIEVALDLSDADFKDVEFRNVTFKEPTTMERLNVDGDFTLQGCIFEGESKFNNSTFHQSFQDGSTFKAQAYFSQCRFLGRTNIRSNFEQVVIFNEAIFADSVLFMGRKDISITVNAALEISSALGVSSISSSLKLPLYKRIFTYIKSKVHLFKSKIRAINKKLQEVINQPVIKSRDFCYLLWNKVVFHVFGIYNDTNEEIYNVFGKEVQLTNVDFQRPERVNFVHTDMSMARVTGTNFFGVQFSDVNWYQSSIKRKGLYEEVILNDNDMSHYKYTLPQIEEAYRNIRTALERNKDYDTASDFYIGERECHRRQFLFFERHFYCIDAWYNAFSRYGTSPSQAILKIAMLIVLYILIRMYLSNDPLRALLQMKEAFLWRILTLISLQKSTKTIPDSIAWLDLACRFIAPVMLALTALSFRARIKRH